MVTPEEETETSYTHVKELRDFLEGLLAEVPEKDARTFARYLRGVCLVVLAQTEEVLESKLTPEEADAGPILRAACADALGLLSAALKKAEEGKT